MNLSPTPEGQTGGKRLYWPDALRAFAICCVVLTHAVENIYSTSVEAVSAYPPDRAMLTILAFTVGRLGVPIFFFLTGWLLLDRDFDYPATMRFYRRNLLGLLLSVEVWITLYNLFNAWFWQEPLSLTRLLRNLLFVENTDMTHMWYIPTLLGLYLLLPVVAAGLKGIDPRMLPLPFCVAFCASFVIPEVNVVLRGLDMETLTALPHLEFAGGTYGLCLLMGYFARQGWWNRLKTRHIALVTIACFLATVAFQCFFYSRGVDHSLWYSNATLVLTAYGIFLLGARLARREWEAVSNLARCAFGVYLLHNPIVMVLARYLPIAFSPLKLGVVFLSALLLSWGIVAVLSRQKTLGRALFFLK